MKEERGGYRPGDRIRMVECRDPYAPVLPGEKGTVAHIDDAGTLHMRWDCGRMLGVRLEEDEIKKVPLEQEWEMLHAVPVMRCDEEQFETHQAESAELLAIIDSYAAEKGGKWVVKRVFLDPMNEGKPPVFEFSGASTLSELLQGCDVKQGADIGFTVKRPEKERSILLVAYGQNYGMPDGTFRTVTEALECRLASPAVARDFHERMDAGWSTRGDAAARLFNSPRDHESLSACIRECRAAMRGKARDSERER